MNFQRIPPIKTYEFYIDLAFKQGRTAFADTRKAAREAGSNYKWIKSEINYSKDKVLLKLTAVQDRLMSETNAIVEHFPQYEEMPRFYQELFNCYFNIDDYKHDLSNIIWLKHRVKQFSNIYGKKIKVSTDKNEIDALLKQFYGRINSMFKQVAKSFTNMEAVRKKMRTMPAVKEGLVNVALFGFPNVGKSTLLSKLTTARPEIANYSFTTKTINVGYAELGVRRAQVFDVPGTLNRFDKMNDIEKQAYLVVSKLADIVIFVFDPTDTYSLEEQEALLATIDGQAKKIINYCSKSDIISKERKEFFEKEKKCITSLEEINKILERETIKKEIELVRKARDKK